jgi:cyclophilin family peptidyl-prolyl cis-trans isomerase/HEAT repeat protein
MRIPLTLLALSWMSCATVPRAPGAAAQVDALEDRRDGDGLVPLAQGGAPGVRARALRALGRLQDPAHAPLLSAALADAHAGVREEAARAAGLLGLSWDPLPGQVLPPLVASLLEAEQAERLAEVREAQLEALGRLGTAPAQARLVERLGGGGAAAERAALGLGALAKRGQPLPGTALGPLRRLLETAQAPPSLRFAAAYALQQGKAPGMAEPFTRCARDGSDDVRAVCVRALGDAGPAALAALASALEDDSPRVAVQAVRGLAKLSMGCPGEGACPALEALSALALRLSRPDAPGAWQPFLALLQADLPARARGGLVTLREGLRGAPPVMDCRAAAALDRLSGKLEASPGCGRGEVPELLRWRLGLQELSRSPVLSGEGKVAVAAPHVSHPHPGVRLAAVGMLAEAGHAAAVPWLQRALEDADGVVAASAAAGLGQLSARGAGPAVLGLAQRPGVPEELRPTLAEALGALAPDGAEPLLRGWLSSPSPSLRSAAAAALGKLTGRPIPAPPPVPLADASPWLPVPEGTRLELQTSRGPIRVALDVREAPRTSAVVAGLAARGFYDGLPVHRVVPDFVAQGGDPRGDGEGGPGFSVRCEVGPLRYGRGAVGMALSGKDTGGSQFFFTHSPQPHLDGRYTAFGQVESGQEVVDSLLEGDTLLHVRVLR